MTNFKLLKSVLLRRTIAKHLLLRAVLVTFAIAIFPSLQLIRDADSTRLFALNSETCARQNNVVDGDNPFSFPGRFLKPMSAYVFPSTSIICKEMANVTMNVFTELVDAKLLKSGVKSLCVGEGTALAVLALQELGFPNTYGMNRHPFFWIMRRGFVYELEFDDGSFDFVFSSDITRVSVPALLVLETERILKPGGIGAMLVYAPGSTTPGSLIKSATPVSLFLKSSDVLQVRSYHQLFTLVVFQKKLNRVNPFEHYQLPEECPSVSNNKPFIERLEPLIEDKLLAVDGGFSYLSKIADISSKKRFVYIDIGAGQFMNSNTTKWFLAIYPVPTQTVDVYVVDHNTTVLSSYVNRPGITFVYHPGLAGNKIIPASGNSAGDNEEFDFLVWFRETVAAEDFVVLKMNAVGVELQLLHELFESGAICLVDELFLRCPDSVDGQGTMGGDCIDLFKGLRSAGVFVHQWFED